jgi:hypothetical protein
MKHEYFVKGLGECRIVRKLSENSFSVITADVHNYRGTPTNAFVVTNCSECGHQHYRAAEPEEVN